MLKRDAAVIGAGPAGLAAAAMLRRRGVDAVVVDRAESVGASWRGHYDRLHLHTVRWLSGLPGYPIPRSFGKWPSRDRVIDYLRAYAARNGLEGRTGVEVEGPERATGGWAITPPRGAFEAERVVIATGYSNVPFL